MRTPVEALLGVAEIGGNLGLADENKLRVLLPADCPRELKEAIRTYKPGLLALLTGPPFVVVRSGLLPTELVFWTASDEGRDLLITHGAPAGLIYTPDELRILAASNTDSRMLIALHRTKHLFNGRLSVQ